jgi:hypothetical protein
MFSLPEQIILSCFFLLSNSSPMLYIHLFPLSVPYFFPFSCCHSSAVPLCHNRQFGVTVLLTISTICHTLGVAVSCGNKHVVLVFVHHLLYSSVIVMNIRYCCLSQLSLFLCDLQSIPNYLVVSYPVGTLSTWSICYLCSCFMCTCTWSCAVSCIHVWCRFCHFPVFLCS